MIGSTIDSVTLHPLSFYINNITSNDVFLGFFALSLLGALVYGLRYAAIGGWQFFKNRCLVTVSLTNNSEMVYEYMSLALKEEGFENKSTRFRLNSIRRTNGKMDIMFDPGDGWHIMKVNGAYLVFHKTTRESKTFFMPEEIVFYTLKRNKHVLGDLVELGEKRFYRETQDCLIVSEWFGYEWRSIYRNLRPMNTVFLPSDTKDHIINDIQWFTDNKEWYAKNGIPYHRGYMLYGPPGTGKTSLVMALAGYFDRPLCTVNMGAIESDDEMSAMFHKADPNAIILLEDIDACGVGQKRDTVTMSESAEDGEVKKSGPTLSGLLNILDGVASPENRIVIMTSNHPDKLDDALTRKGGRVDKSYLIGTQGFDERVAMIEQFLPDLTDDEHMKIANQTMDMKPVDVQDYLIENHVKPNT